MVKEKKIGYKDLNGWMKALVIYGWISLISTGLYLIFALFGMILVLTEAI